MGSGSFAFLPVIYDKPMAYRQKRNKNYNYTFISQFYRCRDSSVGIATRYWLDGPGIESRWGQDFPHPSRPTLRPTQPPIQWVPGKAAGAWR